MSRKSPIRTCVACRRTDDKSALVRLVRTSEHHVSIDVSGRISGRGAYLCPTTECFDHARRSRKLDRALRTNISEPRWDELRDSFFRQYCQTRESRING